MGHTRSNQIITQNKELIEEAPRSEWLAAIAFDFLPLRRTSNFSVKQQSCKVHAPQVVEMPRVRPKEY